MPEEIVGIDGFLRESGFDTPQAMQQARSALEAAGLTNPRKQAMAAVKLERARQVLDTTFTFVCNSTACAEKAAARRPHTTQVTTSPATCVVCAGSNNLRALHEACRLMREAGMTHLVIVGGNPNQRTELRPLFEAAGIECRLIEGVDKRHTRQDAMYNLRWADILVVWGGTPLDHKVSKLYTDTPQPGVRVIKMARRGIESLASEIVRSLSRPGG